MTKVFDLGTRRKQTNRERRKRWIDELKAGMSRRSRTLEEIERVTIYDDRNEWRAFWKSRSSLESGLPFIRSKIAKIDVLCLLSPGRCAVKSQNSNLPVGRVEFWDFTAHRPGDRRHKTSIFAYRRYFSNTS